MMYRKLYVGIVSGVLLLSACKSGDDSIVSSNDYEACNKWITRTMRSDYLWKDDILDDSQLDYSKSPESFFYTLLSDKDGKDSSYGHYYYSYIEKNKNYVSSKAINDDTNSYGINFIRYSVNNQTYEYDRVAYVLPDSPASIAGLTRGDWIVKIDGSSIDIGSADYKKLIDGTTRTLTVYHSFFDKTPVTISLGASGTVTNDPIFYSSVIDLGTRKVGYLIYNQFASGPHDDYNDHTYDKELIDLFNTKFQGVNDFILDLRYNPGGYLSCARLLSRLLVPVKDISSVFCKLTDNEKNEKEYDFNSVDADGNYDLNSFSSLNLSRLYVIATGATASAAEAVINGLDSYMTVIKIGEKTEGKNVGSVNYSDDKYAWDIQPITFSITSSANNDYSSGIVPDYVLNELDPEANPDFAPLGNEDEYLFTKALSLISGETKSSLIKSTRSISSQYIPMNIILSTAIRGLIENP